MQILNKNFSFTMVTAWFLSSNLGCRGDDIYGRIANRNSINNLLWSIERLRNLNFFIILMIIIIIIIIIIKIEF